MANMLSYAGIAGNRRIAAQFMNRVFFLRYVARQLPSSLQTDFPAMPPSPSSQPAHHAPLPPPTETGERAPVRLTSSWLQISKLSSLLE